HWNEVPHRFGLFGVSGEVRPQYFVYQMTQQMGSMRIKAAADAKDIRVLAARDDQKLSILCVNYAMAESQDRLAKIVLAGLTPGAMKLIVYRIDNTKLWSSEKLELIPSETRDVDVRETFSFQIYSPADSVALILLGPGR